MGVTPLMEPIATISHSSPRIGKKRKARSTVASPLTRSWKSSFSRVYRKTGF